MPSRAYDISFAVHSTDPQVFVDNQATGVVVYYGSDARKVPTKAELARMWSLGLPTAVVHENTADPASWRPASFEGWLDDMGFPDSALSYFAADLDPAGRYQEFSDRLGGMTFRRPKALYGGRGVGLFCCNQGTATGLWGSGASSWDHGTSIAACGGYIRLQQLVNATRPIPSTDEDTILSADWGGWCPGLPVEDPMLPAPTIVQLMVPNPANGDHEICIFPNDASRPWHVPTVSALDLINVLVFGAFDPNHPYHGQFKVSPLTDAQQCADVRAMLATPSSSSGSGSGGAPCDPNVIVGGVLSGLSGRTLTIK